MDREIKNLTSKGGIFDFDGVDFINESKVDDLGIQDQVEEEPLNSEDDISDDNNVETADSDNIIICQYEKVYI